MKRLPGQLEHACLEPIEMQTRIYRTSLLRVVAPHGATKFLNGLHHGHTQEVFEALAHQRPNHNANIWYAVKARYAGHL